MIHSISGNVLKDPEAKLNEAELQSIGLTVGLDSWFLNNFYVDSCLDRWFLLAWTLSQET